ncbi:unnamed protein product [Sphenostylis stenocarpa]|uniref:BZIP domain-containing protein n=1 Tax=Sphenostylis stenocarpa TaxID=92480 RepID=A0AA86VB09_9FABA|nr:unnamed protein product [Sphenostylis stenocarpa]
MLVIAMDADKRASTSISFSPSSSDSSSCEHLDRLVDTEEMEAAETLAQLAMCDSHSTDKCTKPGATPVSHLSPTLHSDPSLGPEVADQQLDEKIPNTASVETEKTEQDNCSRHIEVEQDADLLPISVEQDADLLSNSSNILGRCNKSRRNLTAEEKEARRVRRILANRESARQTIRRRQALCDELTKKAATLVEENESLKKEKDLALKEYESLETTNKYLKAQITKSMNTEVEKTPVEPGSSVAEFGNGQSSPSSSLKDKQDNKPCSSSSSLNTLANVDYQAWTEARLINDPPRFSLDGGEKKTGCHILEKYHGPTRCCNGHASAFKQENELRLHSAPNNKVSSTAYIATTSLEKKQEQFICQGKSLADAIAAAEARKRRKELTKQKSIHNRQSRMQC